MTQTIAVPLSQLGGRKAASSLVTLTALPPLSLYIHWPWCVRKCPYCDFNSHEFNAANVAQSDANTIDETTEAAYVQALLRDLENELPRIWGRRVYTVFIGGGTPSLMRPQALDTLLAGIRARLPLEADAEITLEANPGTVEAGRFAAYAAAGVNRVSVGVQSFNPEHLKAIGRIHDGTQAIKAVEAAVKAMPRVNVDIMYGLPNQTVSQASQDLSQAIALGAGHISAYHLTLEANTYFHRYPPPLPDDDLCADMQDSNAALLASAGFVHYETSAYAKPNQRSQHNQNYWAFGDYIGIGAGAHGKISFPDKVLRTVKHKHPKAYLDGAVEGKFMQLETAVAAKELPFEFMLNALRLQQGFDLAWFTERTGQPLVLVLSKINVLKEKGLLETFEQNTQTWLRPTVLGHRFLNDVVDAFL
jgi:putative oxygen-independent coproporphyrinogen III oxidase